MRRYELRDGSASKFWEIDRDGVAVTTRYGRIGIAGKATTKTWGSAAEAAAQYAKIVAEKVKKGYVLVRDTEAADAGAVGAPAGIPARATPGTPPRATPDATPDATAGTTLATGANPDLEAAIRADPDAPAAYLVYADWLQGQGDPLGELIAVQVARAATPGDRALQKVEKDLLKKHAARWLGGLAERGADAPPRVKLPASAWRYGFLHTVRLGDDAAGDVDIDAGLEAYAQLAALPVARFLRDLTIGVLGNDSGTLEYGTFINAMAKAGVAPTLQRLAFDCGSYQTSWTNLGNLAPLYPHLQRLEELYIHMGSMTLGELALPTLRELEVVTGGLTQANVRSVVAASWPALETLVLYFGDENYGADCTVRSVKPLLDGACIPRVTSLGLCNAAFADKLAARLPDARVLRQLTRLDLSKGTLSDEGAAHILAKPAAFAHLAELDVSDSYLTPETCKRLVAVCAKVITDSQGDPEDDFESRYVQVAE